MRYSFFTVLASLFLGTSLALHIEYAGGVLARDGDATAEILPFQGSPPKKVKGGQFSKREPTVINGLLQVRQSCPSGYGLCKNNKCCPLGGDCCPRGCCDPGEWCYSTFCCDRSETGCEQVNCCPSGTHCCKGGGCCKSSQYCVPGGCCPLGEICSGGGGAPPPPPPPPPPPRTTTHAAPPPTTTHAAPPPTTTHRTTTTSTSTSDLPDVSTTSPSKTAQSPSPTRSQSPRPTAFTGEVSVAYQVDDTRITWSSGWVTSASNCTSKCRRTTVTMESFTVIVASATRIYLNIDVVGVVYDVYVNSRLMPLDTGTFLDTLSCTYTPLTLGADSSNINVTVVVVGQPRNGRRQNFDNWSFQLNEILTFDSDSEGNSGSGSSNDAAATFGHPSFAITAVAVLLVTFGSFW